MRQSARDLLKELERGLESPDTHNQDEPPRPSRRAIALGFLSHQIVWQLARITRHALQDFT
jgi:hypothetical protein